jgi:hypothetical protein
MSTESILSLLGSAYNEQPCRNQAPTKSRPLQKQAKQLTPLGVSQVEITEKWLLEIGGWKVMKEARSAYNAGAVLEATFRDGLLKGSLLSGGRELNTGLHVRARTEIENYCSCPDSRRHGIICRHAIAAGLHVALGPKKIAGSVAVDARTSGAAGENEGSAKVNLAPALRVELSESWLPALKKGKIAARVVASKESDRLADLADRSLAAWFGKHGLCSFPAHLVLSTVQVPGFLGAAAGHREIVLPSGNMLGISGAPARLPASVEREGDVFTIELALDEQAELFALGESKATYRCLFNKSLGRLFPVADFVSSDPDFLRDLFDGWPVERDITWVIAHLDQLDRCFQFVEGSAFDSFRLIAGKPTFRLFVEGSLNFIEATLTASYGDLEVAVGESEPDDTFPFEEEPGSGRYVLRNRSAETHAVTDLIEKYGLFYKQKKLIIKGEPEILRFLVSSLAQLRRSWRVDLGQRIAAILSRYEPVSVRLGSLAGVEASGGWFGFSVGHVTASGKHIPQSEIARLLRTGQPKISLGGGRFGLVDLEAAEELEATLAEAGVERSAAEGCGRIPVESLGFLAASATELRVEIDAEFPEAFEVPSPGDLQESLGELFPLLRGYQVDGVAWLAARLAGTRGGVGAILADEMGLGKTVQTLAVLRYLRVAGQLEGTVLVVCPTSLLENWRREAQRFVPEFDVCLYHGSARDAAVLAGSAIVITSYGIVAREAQLFAGLHWGAVVLDEASLIRNPDTAVSRAVHGLDAGCRLALTGTPIENRPADLWSLMRFVRPGYLGDRKVFTERFEKPLSVATSAGAGEGSRGQAAARLRRKISPFVLRRLKSRVAKELPPKIERVLPVELGSREQEAYRRILDEGLAKATDERRRGGQNAARMCLLTTLLRLRQACCDLRLLGLEVEDECSSSKFEALKELLIEAVEGGHRCLVFSQFAQLLRFLRDDLKAGGMPCCYLDGSSQDRAQQVERFQNTPEIPVFLISLKAGGYGLNLTAADTVIHYDPWWNPAVEAQATDRAHRIGQERSVDVYKLVASGTVEENIIRLQRKKQAILDVALDDETPMMTGLGDEELSALLGAGM